jgi:chromate transporter
MREIATGFLKIGATAYGGPAIMGVMQAEFQERRRWVTKPGFVDGLALVNVLPGATATQLAIYLGYVRGGWWGALVAGVCFALPGFVVMLALTAAYATLGVTPLLRGALYGLGPVVLGIFVVAVYRLGANALRSRTHTFIAVAAALAALLTPLGAAAILLLCGGVGLFLFSSKRAGALVLVLLAAGLALAPALSWSPVASTAVAGQAPTIGRVTALFAAIGALTFGGGLSMIALFEEHVVRQLQWLTAEEFIAGLALGQLTPGPILMLAAYVGYKALGAWGAAAAATAAFLPSFVLMLAILPAFERVRALAWARAVMQGIGPGVIGVMAVALTRLAPHAVPDLLAAAALVATVIALVAWRLAPVKLMLAGSALGVLKGVRP